MDEMDKKEREQLYDDLKSIREMLKENQDVPVIHWWAFIFWSVLVAAATIVHYVLATGPGIDTRTALAWIWLPVLIVAALSEGISFATMVSKQSLPLFNRRLGTALLGGIAYFIILIAVIIHLSLSSITPGIAVLVSATAVILYAQLSYSSLLIEAFIGIALGLLFEFAGVRGPKAFLAAGLVGSALWTACGIHIRLLQHKKGKIGG